MQGSAERRRGKNLWPLHAFGVLFSRAVKQNMRDIFVNGVSMHVCMCMCAYT
jgi:hypothetical protein